MPLLSTFGAASARGYGFLAAGAASYAFVCSVGGAPAPVWRLIIETDGSGTNWGNLNGWATSGYYTSGGASNSTRGYIFGGVDFGGTPYAISQLRSLTYTTSGDSTYSASLSTGRANAMSANNDTRGVAISGSNYNTTVFPITAMEYWTTATGGSVGSFGSMSSSMGTQATGTPPMSNTRIVFGGGDKGQFGATDVFTTTIEYITTATTGNSAAYGDLAEARINIQGASSSTRGLFAGGQNKAGTNKSDITYITIATTGNPTSFGNLTTTVGARCGGSNKTKAIFPTGATTNDKVTIATTGNGSAWGQVGTFSSGGFNTTAFSCNANGGLSA